MVDPTFLPIHLTGGIGDVIMAVDAVKFLSERYQVAVYTKHTEAFRYFCDIPVSEGLPQYTWHLEFDTLARFVKHEQFRGFLLPEHEALFVQSFTKMDSKLNCLFKQPSKFFLIADYAKKRGLNRRQFPLHCLGFKEYPPFNIVGRNPTEEKIITIHDGYDVQYHKTLVQFRATKQWDYKHWLTLVRLLKTEFPDYKIIQLGAVTARKILYVDEQLVDKTTLTEAFNILAKSALHIDGDSGLVHAATRLQTDCVVMWGPTPKYFYGYERNAEVSSGFRCSPCYGIKDNWNDKCPIGFDGPRCMDELSPKQVFSSCKSLLSHRSDRSLSG